MTSTNKKHRKNVKSKNYNFQNAIVLSNSNTRINILNSGINITDKKQSLDIQSIQNSFKEYLKTSEDEMDYDNAIRRDHRKFREYFCDYLKNNQIIYKTFVAYESLKPKSIKIIFFIFNILLIFVSNALFINDDYVSNIYNSKGNTNFFSYFKGMINRLFYTILACVLLEIVFELFFVEEKKFKKIFIREKNNRSIFKEQIMIFLNNLKCNYIAFSIFVFIFIFISFCYLICFNTIYPHMQNEWIISSIFIFFIIQIISAFVCLLVSFLRFISFRLKSEKIFKISKLII